MRRFFNRPRNWPRFLRGRMFNRLSGGYAPTGYSGVRPRRAMHARHATQTTPYGAAGGGWHQRHVAPHGSAGNVYSHMLAQAMRGQGTNLGRIPVMQGSLTSRLHPVFRKQMAKQGKAAYDSAFASAIAAGSSRAQARAQALAERRHARRHFAGGTGKGTWRSMSGHGLRRVRYHKFHNPHTGAWVRTPHSIYRNYEYNRKSAPKVSQRKFKKVDFGRAMERDDARRKRLNKLHGWKMPLRTYGHGGDTSFKVNSSRTLLKKDGVWNWRKPGGEYTPLRPRNARQRKAIQDAQQLKADQAQWRSELRGLSAPRRTTYTFTPDDPKWRRVPINKRGNYGGEPSRYYFQDHAWQYGKRHPLKSLARRREYGRGYDSHEGYLYPADTPAWMEWADKKRKEGSWHWRRPEGKIRTKAQSLNPAFASSKPFGSF